MAIKFDTNAGPIVIDGTSAKGAGDSVGSDSGFADINPNTVGSAAAASGATASVNGNIGANGRKLNKNGSERAARGSKSAGTAAPAQEKAQFTVNGVAFSIAAMHAMAASFLDAPELVLSEKESTNFATALQAVQKHYNVQITQKSLDHVQFFAALGSIYGPRLAAISLRKKRDRSAKPQSPRADNVFDLRPQQPPRTTEPRPAPVNNRPGETVSVDMEGDPTSAAGSPQNSNGKPMTAAERAFAATPPDMI